MFDNSQAETQTMQQVSTEVQETPSQSAGEAPLVEGQTPTGEGQVEVHYTQKQYSQMQSSLRTESQRIKDERDAKSLQYEIAKAELEEANAALGIYKEEVASPYSDDDEKTAAEKLREARIRLAKDRLELNRETAKFNESMAKENLKRKESIAKDLADRFGFDVDTLLQCEKPEQMFEMVALNPNIKVQSQKEENAEVPKETLPRPTSGGMPGIPSKNKTATDWIVEGLREASKKKK